MLFSAIDAIVSNMTHCTKIIMHSRNCSYNVAPIVRRFYSNKAKIQVQLKQSVEDGIRNKEIKARKHPGTMRAKNVTVPPHIVNAIHSLNLDPIKNILDDSKDFDNYLASRHPPPEFGHLRNKSTEMNKKLSEKEPPIPPDISHQELEEITSKRQIQVNNILRKSTYHWVPIKYEQYQCYLYLIARAAPEYASVYRIFGEIKDRVPDFKPDSFFDFGSGIGTGLWAVRELWAKSILEYFTVDISSAMNDLALLLLCDGNEHKELPFKNFYQRQFLPASSNITYDLVLSAYSLLELPSAKARLETIGILWRKTNHFLVLVEQGTNAGFRLLNEARDYILQLKEEGNQGHVFAPCPGDFPCPRFAEGKTPCNFMIMYSNLGVGERPAVRSDVFTYVVLRKGKRSEDDPQWPRIVRSPIIRKKNTICRMCTARGKLEEIIFTKSKHGQPTYWCARSSSWGDVLPIKITSSENEICDSSVNSLSDTSDDNVTVECIEINDSTEKESSIDPSTQPNSSDK